ncbi:hypothetical protein A2U01_0074439, partial [Trifolium medium]|nr:hypothetical protein [Trifolium medium]
MRNVVFTVAAPSATGPAPSAIPVLVSPFSC